MREHRFDFVLSIMHRLAHAQIATWVCGGWAEELWGVYPPRSHRDIDLLYLAPNFDRLDQWLTLTPDLSTLVAKQFSHKRAFLCQHIMVEVILLEPTEQGRYRTNFFDQRYQLVWPPDTLNLLSVGNQNVPIASKAFLQHYRHQYHHIAEAYQQYLRKESY